MQVNLLIFLYILQYLYYFVLYDSVIIIWYECFCFMEQIIWVSIIFYGETWISIWVLWIISMFPAWIILANQGFTVLWSLLRSHVQLGWELLWGPTCQSHHQFPPPSWGQCFPYMSTHDIQITAGVTVGDWESSEEQKAHTTACRLFYITSLLKYVIKWSIQKSLLLNFFHIPRSLQTNWKM